MGQWHVLETDIEVDFNSPFSPKRCLVKAVGRDWDKFDMCLEAVAPFLSCQYPLNTGD